jgi:hypothetical protein
MKDPFVMRAFEKDPFGVVALGRLPAPGATSERRVHGMPSAVKGAFTA